MRIAIPQLNYITGNVQKNYEIMLEAIKKAQQVRADLIVFPELAICGPFPQDLLEKEAFVDECRLAVDRLAMECEGIAAIVGAPNLDIQSGIMYNSAYFIQNGEVTDGVHKTILSDYDVFEESRYFVAGEENTPLTYKNQKIRILFDEYESEYIDRSDHIVLYLGIIPFTTESLISRQEILKNLSYKYSKNILTVNMVGGATSILLDGNSLGYNYKGKLVVRLKEFETDFQVVDTHEMGSLPAIPEPRGVHISLVHRALVHGIRDFFEKNGFTRAILGLSGGIDSAIVAALAAEAIGAKNVMGVLMPSVYSSDHSLQDAYDLAENLGISHQLLPIKEIYDQYLSLLSPVFGDKPFNVAEENLQARIRGALVMAMSNKFGYIALNTSNKSEVAVGYGTLYGDMCGSLGVIGDVYKTDVYKLAEDINREGILIPENTIRKAPSAELRPNQKDQDSLPDYALLDPILKLYIEENLSLESICEKGYQRETVDKVIRLVDRNEYKRNQCPPILKVSKKAFGRGRRIPF